MIDTYKIRCQVLRLALSGKLTIREKEDDSVADLLASVNCKKNIEQKDGCPYKIPEHWSWVKLSDLYEINPKVEAEDHIEAAFIPMQKISAGFEKSFSFEIQKWGKASKNHTRFTDGDVAFAKIHPCFENRKAFIAEELPNAIGGGTTELIVLRQREMLPAYTYYIISDQRFIGAGTASYKGIVGQQRIELAFVKDYLVPVPPYQEQLRIVNQIDTIFAVLDHIDELQKQYKDNVEILRKKVFDAGIHGKLTEQLSEEGTAEEFLLKMQNAKGKQVKVEKNKRSNPLPVIDKKSMLYEVPANWKWCRLSDISDTNIGLTYHPDDIADNGTIVIRSSNIINGKMDYRDLVRVVCPIRENQYLKNNDIVICARNGSKALVGKCAIYEENSDDVAFGAFMAVLRTPFYKYIYYYLHTDVFRRYFSADDTKQINQVTQNILREAMVPFPPLAEQERITRRIDEVMRILEEL